MKKKRRAALFPQEEKCRSPMLPLSLALFFRHIRPADGKTPPCRKRSLAPQNGNTSKNCIFHHRNRLRQRRRADRNHASAIHRQQLPRQNKFSEQSAVRDGARAAALLLFSKPLPFSGKGHADRLRVPDNTETVYRVYAARTPVGPESARLSVLTLLPGRRQGDVPPFGSHTVRQQRASRETACADAL